LKRRRSPDRFSGQQRLWRPAPSEEIHHQDDDEDHDEDVEQKLSNAGSRSSDAAEAEYRGYDRDNQCNQRPIKQVPAWLDQTEFSRVRRIEELAQRIVRDRLRATSTEQAKAYRGIADLISEPTPSCAHSETSPN
jgi:hypothetical protein